MSTTLLIIQEMVKTVAVMQSFLIYKKVEITIIIVFDCSFKETIVLDITRKIITHLFENLDKDMEDCAQWRCTFLRTSLNILNSNDLNNFKTNFPFSRTTQQIFKLNCRISRTTHQVQGDLDIHELSSIQNKHKNHINQKLLILCS